MVVCFIDVRSDLQCLNWFLFYTSTMELVQACHGHWFAMNCVQPNEICFRYPEFINPTAGFGMCLLMTYFETLDFHSNLPQRYKVNYPTTRYVLECDTTILNCRTGLANYWKSCNMICLLGTLSFKQCFLFWAAMNQTDWQTQENLYWIFTLVFIFSILNKI